MKTGKTLVQLAQEIERQQATKVDLIAPAKLIRMEPDARLNVPQAKNDSDVRTMTGLAHDQMGERIGIPAKYYDKMKAEAPALLATNVNEWLSRDDSKRLVRILDGNVRAFLSDRYRPLENAELAEAVLPVLARLDVEIMSAEITERRLYIKAVHKSVRKDMPTGAQFGQGHVIVRSQAPGIVISNSEVGSGALSVECSIFDEFCTNLAVFKQHSMRKYHTGAQHVIAENLTHLLSDDTRRKTDAALWAQVGDVVRGAFDEVAFGKRVDAIAGLQEIRIEGDAVQAVELVAKQIKMTGDESKSVLRHLIEGGNLSAFGLYNAVTRTAQDAESYDRASEIERMGGEIIELQPHQWRTIAQAKPQAMKAA